MSIAKAEESAAAAGAPLSARAQGLRRFAVVALLGTMTILTYGTTYYLLTILAPAIVAETGWPLPLVVGGLSLGLLVSGLVSPWIGRRIEARGGRAVLPLGCVTTALGLILLSLADSLWLYGAAWILLGLGMAGCLYEAAFASLGRQFGQRARASITLLTLFGGFASTVCWPLSAAMESWLGWRGTCLVYAGALGTVALLVRLSLAPPPAVPAPQRTGEAGAPEQAAPRPRVRRLWLLVVLGFCLALSASITAVVSVHLVGLLDARGLGLAAAVAIGTLIGPSQVGARVLEYVLGRRLHPLWTLVVSTLLMATGLGMLALGWGWIALAFVLYGSGVGLKSIVNGTVPLALIGPRGYATAIGRLAAPSLVMQALAPIGAAELLRAGAEGAEALLWTLAGCALLNVLLGLLLLGAGRRQRAP